MDDLLFTFNRQQLSTDLQTLNNRIQHNQPINIRTHKSNDISLRAFRSKRLRRYEQVLESIYPTPAQNIKEDIIQQARLISSQNIKLVQQKKVSQTYSSKTIEEINRIRLTSRSKKLPVDFNKKYIQKSLNLTKDENKITIITQLTENQKQQLDKITKKRSITTKQTPKIHFPINDKKLPQVFRFRSISHEKVQSPKKRYSKSKIPSIQKLYNPMQYMHNSQPTKTKKYMQQYQNVEQTPYFKKC